LYKALSQGRSWTSWEPRDKKKLDEKQKKKKSTAQLDLGAQQLKNSSPPGLEGLSMFKIGPFASVI